MKVNEQTYLKEKEAFQNRIKKLRRQHANTVKNHDHSIKKIKDKNQLEIANEKALQEERKFVARENANKEIAEFLNRNQQKIDKHQADLVKTKKLVDDASKQYAETSKARMIHKQVENEESIQTAANKASDQLRDIAYEGQQKINKLKDDIAIERNQIKSRYNLDALADTGKTEADINKTTQDFVAKKNFVNREYEKHLKHLENSQKSHLQDVNRKQLVVKNQQLKANQDELKTIESKYKQVLKDTHLRYKEKMNKMTADNQAVIDNIKDVFKKQIQALKEKQLAEKAKFDSRSTDPFYKIIDIKPEIQEQEKDYLISIKVPEHEKEGVLLTPFERKIRVSFSRRYGERVDTSQGFNRSARSESGLQEFSVKDILDPSKVSQEYKNGVLMFKVAKK